MGMVEHGGGCARRGRCILLLLVAILTTNLLQVAGDKPGECQDCTGSTMEGIADTSSPQQQMDEKNTTVTFMTPSPQQDIITTDKTHYPSTNEDMAPSSSGNMTPDTTHYPSTNEDMAPLSSGNVTPDTTHYPSTNEDMAPLSSGNMTTDTTHYPSTNTTEMPSLSPEMTIYTTTLVMTTEPSPAELPSTADSKPNTLPSTHQSTDTPPDHSTNTPSAVGQSTDINSNPDTERMSSILPVATSEVLATTGVSNATTTFPQSYTSVTTAMGDAITTTPYTSAATTTTAPMTTTFKPVTDPVASPDSTTPKVPSTIPPTPNAPAAYTTPATNSPSAITETTVSPFSTYQAPHNTQAPVNTTGIIVGCVSFIAICLILLALVVHLRRKRNSMNMEGEEGNIDQLWSKSESGTATDNQSSVCEMQELSGAGSSNNIIDKRDKTSKRRQAALSVTVLGKEQREMKDSPRLQNMNTFKPS